MHRNPLKIYLFSFFWMFLAIMPVIVPLFMSRGLSVREVFELQAVFGLAVVLLEVPTGYLCDLWGRTRSLLIGSFLSGVGFTYLLVARGFYPLLAYELLIALAFSFVSGADVALLYDSHAEGSERAATTRGLARLQLASVGGESAAALLGGALAAVSFGAVVALNAVTGWIPFLIALNLKEPAVARMPARSHLANFREVLGHLFASKDPLLLLCFVNLALWGLSTFCAVWMIQAYWQAERIPLAIFGALWAALNLTVGVVGTRVHAWESRFGPVRLLLAIAVLPVVGYVGMGLSAGAVGVAFGFCFYVARGLNNVLLRDALNWRTPARMRATANSLQSMFFRLGFAVVGPLLGWGVDRWGLKPTLLVTGAGFAVIGGAALTPLVRALRRLHPGVIPPSGA